VSTDNNWLSPSGNKSGDVADNNWLAEDCSVKDVSDSSVGGLPHLLKTELLDSVSVGSDCGALNADFVLEHGFGAVDCDLVISFVAVLNGQVVVLGLEVDVGEDVL